MARVERDALERLGGPGPVLFLLLQTGQDLPQLRDLLLKADHPARDLPQHPLHRLLLDLAVRDPGREPRHELAEDLFADDQACGFGRGRFGERGESRGGRRGRLGEQGAQEGGVGRGFAALWQPADLGQLGVHPLRSSLARTTRERGQLSSSSCAIGRGCISSQARMKARMSWLMTSALTVCMPCEKPG